MCIACVIKWEKLRLILSCRCVHIHVLFVGHFLFVKLNLFVFMLLSVAYFTLETVFYI